MSQSQRCVVTHGGSHLIPACLDAEDLPLIVLQGLEEHLHVGWQGAFKPE